MTGAGCAGRQGTLALGVWQLDLRPLPAPKATLLRIDLAAEGGAISFSLFERGGVVLPHLLVCQVFPRPEGILGGDRGLDDLFIQAAVDCLQALKLAKINVEAGAGAIVLVESCPKRAGQRDGGDAYDWLSALVGDLRCFPSSGIRAQLPEGEAVQMLSHLFYSFPVFLYPVFERSSFFFPTLDRQEGVVVEWVGWGACVCVCATAARVK